MNKKREPYDRIAVGERIRHKRIQLGLSQDELAVRINRACLLYTSPSPRD